jgi:hypothetical protein
MSYNSKYKVVGQVSSETNSTKTYIISEDRDTGALSCGCPAWRYSGKAGTTRGCKHIRAFMVGWVPVLEIYNYDAVAEAERIVSGL